MCCPAFFSKLFFDLVIRLIFFSGNDWSSCSGTFCRLDAQPHWATFHFIDQKLATNWQYPHYFFSMCSRYYYHLDSLRFSPEFTWTKPLHSFIWLLVAYALLSWLGWQLAFYAFQNSLHWTIKTFASRPSPQPSSRWPWPPVHAPLLVIKKNILHTLAQTDQPHFALRIHKVMQCPYCNSINLF